jgi:hypothetical protein
MADPAPAEEPADKLMSPYHVLLRDCDLRVVAASNTRSSLKPELNPEPIVTPDPNSKLD